MSNINPEDINAFAGMLGKLNSIQEGRQVVDTEAGKLDRLTKNDMTAILSAFSEKSGTPSALTLTPEAITESAAKPDQVGAEFEPKTISPVLGEPEKDHPMQGMLVGEDEDDESREAKETVTVEDTLGDIKTRLTDYLADIKAEKPNSKELGQKITPEDILGPVIKTVKTDSGKTLKIHGNEDDGFRIKVNEKLHSAKFANLDQALMACEAVVAKSTTPKSDYMEE